MELSSTKPQPLFPLGRVFATPDALEAVHAADQDPLEYLLRHAHGDWGDLDSEAIQANRRALVDGSKLLSAYQVTDTLTVWILTASDRSITIILLPAEYREEKSYAHRQ